MDPIIPAVIIGGVAYELTRKPTTTPIAPGPPGYVQPNYGSTVGQIANGTAAGYGSAQSTLLYDGGQAGFGALTPDPDAQAKLDLLQQACKQSYNNMTQGAKTAAANQMNQSLGLNPPLTGNETWQQVARIAGSAGGAAACTAIPGVGVAIAPLCGMAGAYLGVKLEEWMGGPLNDLKNWASSNIIDPIGSVVGGIGSSAEDAYNAVAGAVTSAYNNVSDTVGNAAHDVEDWVSGLF